MILESDNLLFKVVLPDREFILRTQNTADRQKWTTSLLMLIDEIAKSKITVVEVEERQIANMPRAETKKKNWKLENMDKEAYKVLIK